MISPFSQSPTSRRSTPTKRATLRPSSVISISDRSREARPRPARPSCGDRRARRRARRGRSPTANHRARHRARRPRNGSGPREQAQDTRSGAPPAPAPGRVRERELGRPLDDAGDDAALHRAERVLDVVGRLELDEPGRRVDGAQAERLEHGNREPRSGAGDERLRAGDAVFGHHRVGVAAREHREGHRREPERLRLPIDSRRQLDADHHRRPSGAQHAADRVDRVQPGERAEELQVEVGRRDPARRGRVRGEPAADRVDERREDAGPNPPVVVEQRVDHRQPPDARAVFVVLDREREIAQHVLRGWIRRRDDHGLSGGLSRSSPSMRMALPRVSL